ncbi:MAG: DUF1501 domain-containing protein, partial [Planctomycetota bacterium]|nr:DUF1501 domain-containing protein [Planctomycetota bacterium]
AAGDPDKFVVIVNCLGGNDGLNTVVPAHLQPYIDRRPQLNLVENLPAGAVLHDLDGNFKLHHDLGGLKTLWDDSDLHIVDQVAYPDPNQSHFTSQDIYSFGIRDNIVNGDGRGWLGRFADVYCANPVEPLGVIAVGSGRRKDFESNLVAPLILDDVESFTVDLDAEFPDDFALREKMVRDALAAAPAPVGEPSQSLFDTSGLAYELVDRVQQETATWIDPGTYPGSVTGRRMRTISQLVHAHDSFRTKVFYTGLGGFDTHSGQANRHDSLMGELDGALSAFAEDMKAKGKWDDCVVILISEFGRRVAENGSAGTDHGNGGAFMVMGGAVKGKDTAGGMTGALVEADIADANTLPFRYDFRDVYSNVITNHLGVDPTPLFPDPDYTPAVGDLDLI